MSIYARYGHYNTVHQEDIVRNNNSIFTFKQDEIIEHPVLPDRLFLVKVPYLATKTYEELIEHGTLSMYDYQTGKSRPYDSTIFSTCYWNVERMIDAYINGYAIHLCNKNDVYTVYEILQNYLKDIKYIVDNGWDEKVEIDPRYKQIDNFCNEIYEMNNVTIAIKEAENTYSPKNGIIGSYRRRNDTTKKPIKDDDTASIEIQTPIHKTPKMYFFPYKRESLYRTPNLKRTINKYKTEYNLKG